LSAQLHFNICKESEVQLSNKRWNELLSTLVETSRGGKVTVLLNEKVQTDRTIPSNKPEISIRDNEKGTYMLIDVANSGDRNVIVKEHEKILKHKTLQLKYSVCVT
jgi:hypothetical protein